MPTQFYNALRAFQKNNTTNFNRKYGTTGESRKVARTPSQFELARLALRSESPVTFNEKYSHISPPSSPKALGGKRRHTRKSKKSKRTTRRK